jgi:hypothetical protein
MRKLLIILLLACKFVSGQTTVDTTIGGWKAIITRPDDYFTNTDRYYPMIVFFPGAGEAGGTYAQLRTYGPHARIAGGWNGTETIGNGVHKFILVSLSQSPTYDVNSLAKAKITTLLSILRVKTDGVAITGLSAGGHACGIMSTEDAFDDVAPYGPFAYADGISAVFSAQGVQPDDNADFINKFRNLARNNRGARYLGIWGSADGSRWIPEIAASMNIAVPGSAIVVNTADAHNGTAFNNYYGNTASPLTYSLDGVTQNVYQWMLRQMDTTQYVSGTLSAQAGADQAIQLPTASVTVTGIATSGTSPYTYAWTKTSGPNTPTFSSSTSISTSISGLIEGTYVFRFTTTDNVAATAYDEMSVVVAPECLSAAPINYTQGATVAGEIYITNAKGTKPWRAGDTLTILTGTYSVLHIDSLRGDKCRPLHIRFQSGVIVTGALRFNFAEYIDVNGYDASQTTRYLCGPKAQSVSMKRVKYVDFQYVEIGNNPSGVGMYCKIDVDPLDPSTWRASGYVMKKINLSHLWIHDVEGEAFYFGHTSPTGDAYHPDEFGALIPTILLDSATVSYCVVENTGWDGIQVSGGGNGAEIHHNTIRNFGLLDLPGQKAGIILGSMTNGKVYDNHVSNGWGNGIQIFGYGVIDVYNNIIDSVAKTRGDSNTVTHLWKGEQSFYGDDRANEDKPALQVNFYNNSITHISPNENGALSIPNGGGTMGLSSAYNNTFCIPGADGTWQTKHIKLYAGFINTGNILNCVTLPNFRTLLKFRTL